MLTIHDRKKKKEGILVEDALCKALGWYLPLMAKLRVRSVEDLIFRKYPNACPYCRRTPHEDMICKSVRGTESTVNHKAVRQLYEQNKDKRPQTLTEWQRMFSAIYPRAPDDRGRSTLGLFEELGELGEAVRVFDRYPKYFAGEAADVFSYLMGIANEHMLRAEQEDGRTFDLEREFLQRFPGLCTQCGFRVCVCPSIPKATVGRMAKELDIGADEDLFHADANEFVNKGRDVAAMVLENIGGYSAVIERFPFDRGDANRALIVLCLKLADSVETSRPELADNFRSAAVQFGSIEVEAGSARDATGNAGVHKLARLLREAWRELPSEQKAELMHGRQHELVADIGAMLGRVRVLFVHATPLDEVALRVDGELRAIREAIKLAGRQSDIIVETLPAATPDDLRRKLFAEQFEIVHFSGHANKDSLVLDRGDGTAIDVPIDAFAKMISANPSVRCVILNACDSAVELSVAFAPCVVGMDASIDDEVAIAFARGFYDTIAANESIDAAVSQAILAAELCGLGTPAVKILKKGA